MNKDELISFEKEVAAAYCDGKIRAPIHLSDGNEDQLIEIFRSVRQEDWVFSTWRSHYHALLHGVPRDHLMQKIMRGESITIMCPEYRFFSSAIVGGTLPIAVGVALAAKRTGRGEHVWCFVGDMGAETGGFHECVKYSQNFDLPITFVIEDNGQSVGTPTSVTWGRGECHPRNTMPQRTADKVYRYHYNKQVPHVGAGTWISFTLIFGFLGVICQQFM